MGKGKYRHCQSRQEAVQRLREKQRQQKEAPINQIMKNANHARRTVEQARIRMRGDRK